jgi:hypothetical protein
MFDLLAKSTKKYVFTLFLPKQSQQHDKRPVQNYNPQPRKPKQSPKHDAKIKLFTQKVLLQQLEKENKNGNPIHLDSNFIRAEG